MKLRMPRLHPKQEEIRVHPARFKIVSCGRRFGKTLLAVVVIFACAAQGGAAWWVGPTSREAKIGWKHLREMAGNVPGAVVYESTKEIHFPTGGWLAVLSAESATLRGEGLDLIVIDEAAFLYDLERVWTYDLRAALSDRQGRAIFISSPDSRNYFYRLYQYGQDDAHPDWMSWQATSYDNPYLDKAEIDAARDLLPEWAFRQEYLAEFISFAGKVYKAFTPESDAVIQRASFGDPAECWGGIDFGFKNPTVACVGGLDRDDRLAVIDGAYQSGLTTSELIPVLRDFQDRYDVRRWFADPAEPKTIKELCAAGLPVVPAPRIKGDLDRSYIRYGVMKVETRLVNGKLLIAEDTVPHDFIRELDVYRYPDAKAGAEAKETPLKVDDHFPDALRYMVVGLDDMRGRAPRVRVAT